MAGWWLPMPMLAVLLRLSRGHTLICNVRGKYVWKESGHSCSGTAKAMVLRGLISQSGLRGEMTITPTGSNELHSNRGNIGMAENYLSARYGDKYHE